MQPTREAAGRLSGPPRSVLVYIIKYYKVPLRDVCDVKSRGLRKFMKRDTRARQQYSQLIYVGGNTEHIFHEE